MFLLLSLLLAAVPPSAARRTPLVQAVERIKGAVVNINAEEIVKGAVADDPWALFFGRARMRDEVRTSLGSGFVFDERGYVLTNYHVVARGSRIKVGFEDGSDYTAKVVGSDPGGDLAVLKIESEKKFPSASLGNSGGPLLNADGNVIGVCSAIYANALGIGFAIPIDRALRVARELQRSGELADAWWGFEAESLDAEAAAAHGVRSGALVTRIEDGSPAEKAGLRRGDAIVRGENSPVRHADELRFLLRDVPVGTRVALGLVRAKEKLELGLTAVPLTPERAERAFEMRSGLKLVELSVREAREAGYETRKPLLAIQSVEGGSMAASAGLRRGDPVMALNSDEVDTLRDFRKALSQARKSGQAVLLVQRGYRLQEFSFELG